MTKDELKRANDITKEIEIINTNLVDIEKVTKRNGKWDEDAVILLSDGRNSTELYDEILFIPIKEIVSIYIMKAQLRIENLKKELESL